MIEREAQFSDAIDALVNLMESAPSTSSMLRLSRLVGLVFDAMREEAAEPAIEESVQ